MALPLPNKTVNEQSPDNILSPSEVALKIESGDYLLEDSGTGRSKVWLVFMRIRKSGGERIENYVYCKYCKNIYKYNKLTTSNLVKHSCYRALQMPTQKFVFEEPKPEPSDSFTEVTENSTEAIENSMTPDPLNSCSLTNLITKWMISECQSYELLQSKGLRAVFQELAMLGSKFGGDIDVTSLLPKLPEARKNLNEIYALCSKRLKREIASVKQHGLSFTSYTWTDNDSKQSYIVLTVHFIRKGVFKFRLLGLQLFESAKLNTNKIISDKTKQILEEFGCKLLEKSIFVTEPANKFSEILPDAQHIPCISQLLSEAIFESIKQVPKLLELINTCSNLVDFLIKSEQQTLLDGFFDNSTCSPWLKNYKMLNWIAKKSIDIEKALETLDKRDLISGLRVNLLRAVVKTLQPFEDAIETLEDNRAPTLHLVIVYLHELKKSCDTSESEFQDFDFIEELKENLCSRLQKIMTESIITIHKIALFLFPPTNKLVQFNNTEKGFIEDECVRLMKNFKSDNNSIQQLQAEPVIPTPVSKRKNLFSDFMVSKTNTEPSDIFNQELQHYKTFDAVYRDDFNVVNWWELHKENFPLLYKLSCTVLATPATCAASKRIISDCNSLFNDKSIQIAKDVEREKILFLNYNAENDEFESKFFIQ